MGGPGSGRSAIDLTGQRIGLWLVKSRAENRGKHTMWNCVCACGAKHVVQGGHLRSGGSVSCFACSRGDVMRVYDMGFKAGVLAATAPGKGE